MTSSIVRTFVAICCPDDVRDALAAVRRGIDTGGVKVRWSSPETLHLTMKFLGDIADDLVGTHTEEDVNECMALMAKANMDGLLSADEETDTTA